MEIQCAQSEKENLIYILILGNYIDGQILIHFETTFFFSDDNRMGNLAEAQ